MSETSRDLPPRLHLRSSGRSGAIVYEEGRRALELWWEVSGSPEYELLLAPLDLGHWTTPDREPIALSKQLEILASLRNWLAGMNIRTDVERPPESASCAEPCGWAACGNPRLRGLACCARHFDPGLLAG